MSLLSSRKVKNRYQLKERLGTGGMGIVYRARDLAINSDIALKTLSDTRDPIALRMFREECDKLARIIHPNVVEIRDVGEIEEDGARKPYMVMPFLRGRTLDRILLDSPGGLLLDRALEILLQVSRGLQATHESGLIHRDIKPSNIFVLEDDSVKLIDFGVAHYAENLLTVTRKGTLMYMAPEQVVMEGISPLSDIFSLGVVAYETLTGRRPFEGRTERDLVDNILHRNPPPASRFNLELNSLVDQTLQKALAKLPAYRFQSAREFGEVLRRATLHQSLAIFDPGRLNTRIEQAWNAMSGGGLDEAGEILNQLELEGCLDERILRARQAFDRFRSQRRVASLLASARVRIEAQEYTPAAKDVEEALQLDSQNAEVASLRKEIEHARAQRDVADWLATARRLAGDYDFRGAKEAVEQALEICPNELAALDLRSSIQQAEQEYYAVLNEKHSAARRAAEAITHCDPAQAWEAIQQAVDLDRHAPEPDNTAADLRNLFDRIRAASHNVQIFVERARKFYHSGDLEAALACCDEALGGLPEHLGLRVLKLEIQEAQNERTEHLIASAEHEIEAEPDLNRRIEFLKSASERFSGVEYFASRYRAACQRRDFAESLVIKARVAEQEHRLADALEALDLIRSIHPSYPGLEAEIARLEQSRELKIDYERRESLLRQTRAAIEAREFAGALYVIRAMSLEFNGDVEIGELRAAAEEGAKRARLAGDLLDESMQLADNRHYDEALRKLDQASSLDLRKRELIAARQHVLVEQARSLFDTDWRRARTLLKYALELAPGRESATQLLEFLEERRRHERLEETIDRVRQLERTHDYDGALRASEQALAENPEHPELTQTAARLRRLRGRRYDAAGQPPSAPDTPGRAFLRAAWEKASAVAHRSRYNSARRQLTASRSSRNGSTDGGGVVFAEKTPSNMGTPSTPPEIPPPSLGFRKALRINSVLFAFIVGTVATAILLAFLLPRRKTLMPVISHPASVVPQRAILPLQLNPLDAQVTIDGVPASLRSGRIEVQPGTHLIEARSPGYKPFSRSVEIAAQTKGPLDITLVPISLPPAIQVDTDLQSGTVFIDNNRAGVLEGGQFSLDAPSGPHRVAVLAPSGGRYSFAFTLGQNPVWSVEPPKSTAYGTPILAALSSTEAHIACGRPGLAFRVDDGQRFPCTATGKNLPPLANGNHKLTLLEGSRSIAVHNLDYQGAPLLSALITTGAQFGGLVIQGTEDTFDVSVNGYLSKRPAKAGHWRRLLKPGDYVIAISKQGFNAIPSTLNVSVAPGVDTLEQISFTLVPVHAHLRLQSQPGTDVSLNGKPAGIVPESGMLDLPQLSAGTAELRLHHKGFADVQQAVTLANGDNQRTIFLPELKAKISLDVDPPNAQVVYSIAGNSVRHPVMGNTMELPPGTYDFEASAPGRATAASVFAVGPGETKTLSLRLDEASPTVRNLNVWPGWDLENGWLVREKPGTIFRSLPERTSCVAFSARWERQKTLVHWFGGPLNLLFRNADGARAISFRITVHGVSWSMVDQSRRQMGKFPLNLGKNPATIQAEIRASGIALTINGTPLTAVGPNLSAESKPVQFGFTIDQDQVIRLAAIHITTQQPSASN